MCLLFFLSTCNYIYILTKYSEGGIKSPKFLSVILSNFTVFSALFSVTFQEQLRHSSIICKVSTKNVFWVLVLDGIITCFYLFSFLFYCHSITVVPIFHHYSPLPYLPPTSPIQPSPPLLSLSMGPLYMLLISVADRGLAQYQSLSSEAIRS